jgi:demethylmenaquinone methyltransferase/2-methoxy-6-polyprenyl-1,4-benzoquinol methylase
MMRRYRVKYYNAFSHVYDKFIALHSKDLQQKVRNFLVATVNPKKGETLLDICTGTGSLLAIYAEKVGEKGRIIGIDFSSGMLKAAQRKTNHLKNIFLVQADVSALPLKHESADAISCSHAFYELKGKTADSCVREAERVLKPGKTFFMMEHEVPKNRFIRGLYYLRLLSMGSDRMHEILKDETRRFIDIFGGVDKIVSSSGKSKIVSCRKKQCQEAP